MRTGPKLKQFCRKGHDVFICGRNSHKCCIECSKEYQKKYSIDNKERKSAKVREWQIKNNFGITVEDYDRMFKEQEGKCAICKKHQLEFKRRFAVDHDHKTGKIRSLLCNNCNLLLGMVEDSTDILRDFILYLENYNRIFA